MEELQKKLKQLEEEKKRKAREEAARKQREAEHAAEEAERQRQEDEKQKQHDDENYFERRWDDIVDDFEHPEDILDNTGKDFDDTVNELEKDENEVVDFA